MTNDCDRSHSVMSRHNYMRKRNWQLLPDTFHFVRKLKQWATFCHDEVGCSCQSLRQFCLTSAAALWWNRIHDACISKSQTVLVDSCWCISFGNWKNVLPRLAVRKQVRARLRHVRDPGTTQSAVVPPSTMHPKHTLDGAMGEETASLWATT